MTSRGSVLPIIELKNPINNKLVLILRLFAGFVWFGTVIRRIFTPNFSDFEQRINSMANGFTLFPSAVMEFAVSNWFLIFLIVLILEILASISLLGGILSRGGALIATVNGFAIGMAGIGLGFVDLLIPWFAAFVTLVLLVFTHPGQYKGIDEKLIQKDLPKWVLKLT